MRAGGLTVHEAVDRQSPTSEGDLDPRGVRLQHTGLARADPDCHVLVDRDGDCVVHSVAQLSSDPSASHVCIAVEYAGQSADPAEYATPDQKQAAIRAAALIVGRLGADHRAVTARVESDDPAVRDPFCWDMVLVRDAVRRALEQG